MVIWSPVHSNLVKPGRLLQLSSSLTRDSEASSSCHRRTTDVKPISMQDRTVVKLLTLTHKGQKQTAVHVCELSILPELETSNLREMPPMLFRGTNTTSSLNYIESYKCGPTFCSRMKLLAHLSVDFSTRSG